MTVAGNWARLPAELRARKQWLVSRGTYTDKAPLSIDATTGALFRGSSTDPLTWLDFDTAAHYAHSHGLHVGYVLHEDDEFTCIDFDVCDAETQAAKGEPHDPTKWTTQEQFNWFWQLVQQFDSYTELSRSGKGLHIWVRAKIPSGIKKSSIEIYSNARFIICTGAPVWERPVREAQPYVEFIAAQLKGEERFKIELVEHGEELDDHTIMERAWNAENSQKFRDLWEGRWREYGYPSQSEADLSLMSMFTFYSKSNEQCRRLFRMSALGVRKKAVKDNRYLDFTLKLIRAREARAAKHEQSGEEMARMLIEAENRKRNAPAVPLHVPGLPEPTLTMPPASVAVTLAGPVPAAVAAAGSEGVPWPPGFAGHIAHYIYNSAPRPVKEVAIVGALGLLAGICGKAFYFPSSGLNLYMILIARSAIGKEAMHSGVSALIHAAAKRVPDAISFVSFNDMASGQALVKACAANPSFVNVAGEWGHKLRRLAQEDGRDASMASLRQQMTNLYQKSGPQSMVGGITYSNADNNVANVSGVAYSMIGETTPNVFYESLTQAMMEDGFLSRFTIVEYDGPRPPLNKNAGADPDNSMADALAQLCAVARGAINRDSPMALGRTDEAARIMEEFEKECDVQINSSSDETWRQMWNRASIKSMRIAGLLAIADNWTGPVIQKQHIEWAIALIRRDMGIMIRRVEAGDVGSGDDVREKKLLAVLRQYIRDKPPESYKIPSALRDNGIVPRKYLQIRTCSVQAFAKHRLGATAALDIAIKSLLAAGWIMNVQKDKVVEGYNFHGDCYRILDLPDEI
jgi:hypothetical protein